MQKSSALVKLLLVPVAALALGLVPVGSASASCAGPVLKTNGPGQATIAPVAQTLREPFTVSGEWFHSGCDDTGQGSGCGAHQRGEAPLKDVELILEQGTQTTAVATADASSQSKRYSVMWTVDVPSTFIAGPALLRAAGAVLPIDLQG